jgi:glutathione S-transferase
MIRFYFHPTPNPAKVGLFLEEAGMTYEAIPVDTSKGEQHAPSFLAINPNGKVPAIVDTEGPGGREARVFDSTAILLYLAEKTGTFSARRKIDRNCSPGSCSSPPASARFRAKPCISNMPHPPASTTR